MYISFLAGLGVILLVIKFTSLANESQARMWEKSKKRANGLSMQRDITMGKSHCR